MKIILPSGSQPSSFSAGSQDGRRGSRRVGDIADVRRVFAAGWRGPSLSGTGSSQRATAHMTDALRAVSCVAVPSGDRPVISDAGCGDMTWLPGALPPEADYAGYDVCEWPAWGQLREDGWDLTVANLLEEDMRPAHLVMCRDVMIHMPNDMVRTMISRCAASAPWLLATTYLSGVAGRMFSNEDRQSSLSRSFSRLDLRLPPFSLGRPVLLIPEAHDGKFLGLWDMQGR